jgi:hypothetical protein
MRILEKAPFCMMGALLLLIVFGCTTSSVRTARIRVGMLAKEAMRILNDNADPTDVGIVLERTADNSQMIGLPSYPQWYILADETLVMVTYGLPSETCSAVIVGIITTERGIGYLGKFGDQKFERVRALDIPPAAANGKPGVRIWVGMPAEHALRLLGDCAADITAELERSGLEYPEPDEADFPTHWHYLRCFRLADGTYIAVYFCVDSDYRPVVGHLRVQKVGEHGEAAPKSDDFESVKSVLVPSSPRGSWVRGGLGRGNGNIDPHFTNSTSSVTNQ